MAGSKNSGGKGRGGKTHGKKRRIRLFDRSVTEKLGLPPGTVIPVGSHRDFKPFANLLQYNSESQNEFLDIDPAKIAARLRSDQVNWLNVEGVHEPAFVQAIASVFDLHPLVQEDIVNTSHRPEFESYPGYFFFVFKMLYLNRDGHLTSEHISIVLKGNTVITFQETPGDVFGRIRDRIRSQTGKVRTRSADYLLYMLIDSIVDGYYQVVDHLGERIDRLEDELRCGPRDQHLARMFEIRRESLFLRKNIMPVRDLLNKVHVEGTVFQEYTKLYLKDISDQISQVADALNLSMEMTTVLIDTYHSMQNQRLNAVMKTLTMISTLFLPLNFIAGIYGMNFKHMPELEWQLGYPMSIGIMLMVFFGMMAYFVKKGWLLENRTRRRDFFFLLDDDQDGETSNAAPGATLRRNASKT